MARAIRWSDHDRHAGPLTWAWGDAYKHWAVVLASRGEDDQCEFCTLRINLWKLTLILALPAIIRPWREKVYPTSWDESTIKRLGRDWYWDVDQRSYGFSISDGFLIVYYGRGGGSSCDSRIQQQWSYFLPWRHVRHSLYGLAGEHHWTDDGELVGGMSGFDALRAAEATCPVARFAFEDFDGKRLVASTRIEEREWRFGAGWFKWLSLFRRPKISRSLSLTFSGEVGPEKGSWKGGTIGTSIEMVSGELHESAFRRYCDEEHRSKYRKYRVKFLSLLECEPEGSA